MIELKRKKLVSVGKVLVLIVAGLILNLILAKLMLVWSIPLFLDCVGTILVAMIGGTLPAIVVGFFSNVFNGISDPITLYYGVINALIAVLASFFYRKGVFRSIWKSALAVLAFAAVGGALGSVMTWFLYGFGFGEGISAPFAVRLYESGAFSKFWAQFLADVLIDLIDKTVAVLFAVGIFHLLPEKPKKMYAEILRTNSYDNPEHPSHAVRHSLLRKVIAFVLMAEILLGTLACAISFFLYQEVSIRKFSDICTGVTDNAALAIDPSKVSAYLENGRNVPGYEETEQRLYGIRDSFPQIEYIYAYRIEEDGCHVVFDLSTDEVEASEVGDVIEFDESFEPYLPALLAGGQIDPIITNDTYGWLLTVYKPILDPMGNCVCYICADISMEEIIVDEAVFIIKMIALFFGVSIILMSIVLELVKRGIVFPVNAMAKAANEFAYDTETGRADSLERLENLNIRAKDEIGNLYLALSKMAQDSASYIKEVKLQSDLITKMQEDIILDFAEMVEARDQCTGDHIKKTSRYVEAIARELQREGRFPEILDDAYIAKLIRSAPLHDVGKIKISDLILNKPGRLTDEEFALMKTHTTEGRAILTRTSSINDSDSSGYLKEAVEMATYHHERWDGTGYPCGAKGEQIPLSARIMAVADVFDALVSRRSYKEPFSFEKAIAIIREESGTHFDPVVVEAFLNIAEEAYKSGTDETEKMQDNDQQP